MKTFFLNFSLKKKLCDPLRRILLLSDLYIQNILVLSNKIN